MTGCSNIVEPVQVGPSAESRAVLEAGHSMGQTMVARRGGLNGIEVALSPTDGAQGRVVLHLRDSPLASTDILTSSVTLSPLDEEGFYRFAFSPIFDSHTQYYYASFEYRGTGQVEVPLGRLEEYQDGTFYDDHVPQESQLSFRLSHDVVFAAGDVLLATLKGIGWGVVTLALLFFAGYWMVRKWAQVQELDFTSTLVLSFIVFLAAWMVFLVWIDRLLGLEAWMVRLLVSTSALAGLFCFIQDRRRWRRRSFWLGSNAWSTLALWAVVTLSIGLRLFIGRGMVMLPGSDAYHHTLIVKLFEEQGGIPSSYEPYAPLISFSYHFGFHSIVALVRWLFGTELLVTTKSVALVLNGAIAAVVALVAEQLARRRRAGIVAAAFVGLICVSPFCLLRWSRFTQETGLLFLAAGVLAWIVTEEGRGRVVSSLLIAAMLFSHYRAMAIWIPFAAIALTTVLFHRRWYAVRSWVWVAAFSLLLAIPWLIRVLWVQYDPHGLRIVPPVLAGGNDLQRLGPVARYVANWPLLVVSILLAGFVWWDDRISSIGRVLVAWCLVLAGGVLALTTVWAEFTLVDANTVLLSLPISLSIIAGIGGDCLWNSSRAGQHRLLRGGGLTLLALGVAIGLFHLPSLLQADESLLLRPGVLVALEWIADNTPEDSLILTSAIELHWSPGWIVGADAGYWLPLLAHRSVTVPPMLYPLEWGDPSILLARLEASRRLPASIERGNSPVSQLLSEYGVTQILTGLSRRSLSPSELVNQEGIVPMYRQDRIWLFGMAQ
jgi:hypothetical protein